VTIAEQARQISDRMRYWPLDMRILAAVKFVADHPDGTACTHEWEVVRRGWFRVTLKCYLVVRGSDDSVYMKVEAADDEMKVSRRRYKMLARPDGRVVVAVDKV